MNLKAEVQIPEYDFSLTHKDKILSIGSCFSDNIGLKLKELWFDIEVNPFGVLFNPISIANLIERALENRLFTKEEVQKRNDIHFIFDLHSKLSSTSADEVLQKGNLQLKKTKTYLEEADTLIFTFGTSFYYELKAQNKVVGNCHKVPQSEFERKKVEASLIIKAYKELILKIKLINPKMKFIFTVSPVRHSKDGFIANNRSKSELLLAIGELENLADVSYFPSYEIQMDELRDYRFYAEDLNHPNKLAINYIFEKFVNSLADDKTKNNLTKVQKIVHQENHRVLFPESEEGKKFQETLKEKKKELQKEIFDK
jgi:hypothetical protein